MKKFLIIGLAIVLLATCYNPFLRERGNGIPEIPGFVWIKPGTFMMGSPTTELGRQSDETLHQVTLTKGFYMAKHQITQEQYQSVMGSNPSYFTIANGMLPDGTEVQGKRSVEMVSWYDALVFCNKLSIKEGLTPAYSMQKLDNTGTSTNPDEWGSVPTGSDTRWNAVTIVIGSKGYRLPTEAQWEYACRAGSPTAWYTGGTENAALQNAAWYAGTHAGNANGKTHEVGIKNANAWGLYDMHGNVYEWCWDWYGSYSAGDQTDPEGAVTGTYRVIRGGSWNNNGQNLRSAYRNNDNPNNRNNNIGFRILLP